MYCICLGGQLCQLTDIECTHLVVDNIQTIPSDVRTSIATVKAEWFWASVQMEVCADERVYLVAPVSILLLYVNTYYCYM